MSDPIKPYFPTFGPRDLRIADQDETQLSRQEVLHGLREGAIACGPAAASHAFAECVVVSRRLVEVVNFSEVS